MGEPSFEEYEEREKLDKEFIKDQYQEFKDKGWDAGFTADQIDFMWEFLYDHPLKHLL